MTLRSEFSVISRYSSNIYLVTPAADAYVISWPDALGTRGSTVYAPGSVEQLIRDKSWTIVQSSGQASCNHKHTGETTGSTQAPLDKRKVGKVQMNLVDSGFPNAMLALGQVMTWAAENKGYLPDDWKNINEPYVAFSGAGARHRNARQRGIEFDDESKMLHLAHEAFNVLAVLELKLTGVIK